MTAPPWGHKPPAVSDSTQYWLQPPPHRSLRCQYWLNRLNSGTWRPNRFVLDECFECAARRIGVWVWEYSHVIYPRFVELEKEDPRAR